jgi:membrane protein required for colicin V production
MTVYDVVMIGLVVAGMIWGSIRGFSWQIASIGSLVVGYFGAHRVSAYMLPFLALYQPGDPAIQRGTAMLLAYLVISGGIFLAAWSLRATLRKMKFEVFDRHLGVVLGGIEGALLGVIGTLFVVSLSPKAREPIFSSQAGHVVARVMDAAGPILPGEVRDVITPYWGRVPVTDSPQPAVADDAAPKTSDDPPDRPTSQAVARSAPSRTGRAAVARAKAGHERLGENDDEGDLKRR